MPGQQEAFQGRQPIVDRLGELVGYDLLCRASGSAERACVDDEDAASLQVMSTIGRMDGAFFVSRTELLAWLNKTFQPRIIKE